MKISRGRTDAFLNAPDSAVRVVLLYGPDQGLVAERANHIAATVVEDLKDPFLVSRFDVAALRQEPAILADTAATFSMTGGRRLLLVSVGADDVSAALHPVLEGPDMDALVVVEAGELSPRSPVRKLCEADDHAAAIPCYADDATALAELITSVARQFDLRIERQAEAFLVQYLGADRAASRAELEKLALFAGDGGTVTLADAMTAIGDGAAMSIDDIVHNMAEGDTASLDRHLSRAFNDGVAPITLLRAAMRHLQRLHLACGAMETGQTAEQAVKDLRPPVMFFHQTHYRRALSAWSTRRLARALEILTQAEIDCKSTGLPDLALCGRALIRVANAARQGLSTRRTAAE